MTRKFFFSIIFCIQLLTLTKNASGQKHKDDYFFELGTVSISSGFSYSDMTEFNIWGRSNKYREIIGAYVPLGIEFMFISKTRLMIGIEYLGQIPTQSEIFPNRTYFDFKIGYNLKNSRRLMLGTCLGIGYNNQRIKFNNNPPSYYQNYGLDIEKSKLVQNTLLLKPEFHLNYIFSSDKSLKNKYAFLIGLRTGAMINALKGKWKYGFDVDSGNGDTFFDFEVIHDAPNIFDTMLFVKLNFGLVLL